MATFLLIVLSMVGVTSSLQFTATGQFDSSAPKPPNVLLILLDDLNTDVGHLKGTDSVTHPQAKTPWMDKFSKSAVTFTHAYAHRTICAPSRASLLSGIFSQKSGNMYNKPWFENPMLRESRNLMEQFKAHGYHVVGTGKIQHARYEREENWDVFKNHADYGPYASNNSKMTMPHPLTPLGVAEGSQDLNFAPLSEVPFLDKARGGWVTRTLQQKPAKVKYVYPFEYVSDTDRDKMPDEINAAWAAEQFDALSNDPRRQPFFMAVGFTKPHTPLYCPKSHFDMFPAEQLQVPERGIGPYHFTELVNRSDVNGFRYYDALVLAYGSRKTALQKFIQAYLACVSFVDTQIGFVLRAVDRSPQKDNTIVVLTSDHGWNNGQHDFLFKHSPWEESARVPLMIRVPQVTPSNGGRNSAPVSLIDIYPTLVDLCGLSKDIRKSKDGGDLDGHSLRPLLVDPSTDQWAGPAGAVTLVAGCYGEDAHDDEKGDACMLDPLRQHYALRTARWRYILYAGGDEELFDHDQDPHELRNLAGDGAHESTLNHLVQVLRNASGLMSLERR